MYKYLIYPIKWELNKNKIYCYGITDVGQRISFEVLSGNTYYLKFDHDLTLDDASELMEMYDSSSGYISGLYDSTILLRNPDFDLLNDTGSWSKSLKNKYGKLYSFFVSLDIQPYSWIEVSGKIRKTKNLSLIVSEENITSSELSNVSPDFNKVKFYWDIEVYSNNTDQFPDPRVIENEIIFISSVIDDGINSPVIYLLYLGTIGNIINETQISGLDVHFMYFDGEKDLIEGFFDLLSSVSPDYIYGYNDASFDFEYLYQRCVIHKIDKGPTVSGVTKDSRINSSWVDRKLRTPFGMEFKHGLNTPGINQIDMLYYARRYYPGLPNHKLDTVSRLFISEGKTGLKIEDMMNYYRTQDLDGMKLAALYSIQDSVLLRDLDIKLNMLDNLINLGNISMDDMGSALENHSLTLLNKIMGSYDFYYLFDRSENKTLIPPRQIQDLVVYSDIYVYDPSSLYASIMEDNENAHISGLGDTLKLLPAEVLISAYYSSYNAYGQSNIALNEYISSSTILELKKNIIVSSGKIDDLPLLYRYDKYVQIDKNNYFALTNSAELVKIGQSRIIKPTFDLASVFIDNYIYYVFGITDYFNPPTFSDEDYLNLDNIALMTRVKSSDNYKNTKSFRYILSKQYEINNQILIWSSVKYYKILIEPGFILKDLYKSGYPIDYDYYVKIMEKYRKILKKINKI